MTDGKAIHSSIQYIEANPVRSGLVEKPEDCHSILIIKESQSRQKTSGLFLVIVFVDWKWSSANVRVNEIGLIPDNFNIPFLIR